MKYDWNVEKLRILRKELNRLKNCKDPIFDFSYLEEELDSVAEMLKLMRNPYTKIKLYDEIGDDSYFDIFAKQEKLKEKYKTPEKFFETWENEPMTEQERQKFNKMVNLVEELYQAKEKIYHYTKELPDWARPTIQKLMDRGIFAGTSDSDLNLPETLMRVLVINDRAGLYN